MVIIGNNKCLENGFQNQGARGQELHRRSPVQSNPKIRRAATQSVDRPRPDSFLMTCLVAAPPSTLTPLGGEMDVSPGDVDDLSV